MLSNPLAGKKQAEALGATVGASVTAKTDILVVGPEDGSKVESAGKKGVEIWDETQFQECINAAASPKKSKAANGKRAKAEDDEDEEAAKPEHPAQKAKAEKKSKEPVTPVPVTWTHRYIAGLERKYDDPEDVVDLFDEISANIETITKNCEAMKDELDIGAAYLYLNLRGLDLSLPDSVRILVNPKGRLLLQKDIPSALMWNLKNKNNTTSSENFRQTRGDEIKVYYEEKTPTILLGAAHADRFKLIWPCTTRLDNEGVFETLNGCVGEYVNAVGPKNAYTSSTYVHF